MKSLSSTRKWTAITLAALSMTVALPSRADEGANTSSEATIPAPPATPPTPPASQRAADLARVGEYDAAYQILADGAGGGGFGGQGASSGGAVFTGGDGRAGFTYSVASPEKPVMITTMPIFPETEKQMKEDLSVMNKLLRDQIGGVSGEATPRVMGIRLMVLGNTPLYIEGCGAIFSTSVNFPLAASGSGAGTKDDKAPATSSAWERARDEINGVRTNSDPWARVARGTPCPPFEQAKVDELIDSIIKVLPEAKNIRSMSPNDWVIITVAGFDDKSSTVRLTLKAKKSDIDEAASGKITAEQFKERVPRRIG